MTHQQCIALIAAVFRAKHDISDDIEHVPGYHRPSDEDVFKEAKEFFDACVAYLFWGAEK